MTQTSYLPHRGPSQSSQFRPSESRPSYRGFDYQMAYGSNPFTSDLNTVKQDVDLVRTRIASMDSGGSGQFLPRVGDQEVKDYLANALSGQRNTLDDYVRRAAGASIKRGGMNVLGGPDLDSTLHHDAMKTLAAGYGQRLGEAMNYNKYLKSVQYGQYADSVRNLQNLLGLQQNYLSNQAGWQERLGNRRQDDWRADVNWKRTAPDRALARARQLQQLDGSSSPGGKSPAPASGRIGLQERLADTPLNMSLGATAPLPSWQTISEGSIRPRRPYRTFFAARSSASPASSVAQSDPMRELELELLRQQRDMERRRGMWEQQDRQRALDDQLTRQQQWGQTKVIRIEGGRYSVKPIASKKSQKSNKAGEEEQIPWDSRDGTTVL